VEVGHASSEPVLILIFKAALLLGMQFRAVPVSRSDDYSLRGHALRDVLDKDATVGTTSSGAVDNIAEIGEVCG
jgi:aromatic-L-amino-acid decarboxylase